LPQLGVGIAPVPVIDIRAGTGYDWRSRDLCRVHKLAASMAGHYVYLIDGVLAHREGRQCYQM